jgi:hypothetical protein
MPRDVFLCFTRLVVVTIALTADLDWIYNFVSEGFFSEMMSRFDRSDSDLADALLMACVQISGLSRYDVPRLLFDAGIEKFFAQNYSLFHKDSHKMKSARILRNLLLVDSVAQDRIMKSELMDSLLDNVSSESFAVKKEIILLCCAMTRSLRKWSICFIERGLIELYMDGLAVGGHSLRLDIVESMKNMLWDARARCYMDIMNGLLSECSRVGFGECLAEMVMDIADEKECLLKAINSLIFVEIGGFGKALFADQVNGEVTCCCS